MQKQKYVVKP